MKKYKTYDSTFKLEIARMVVDQGIAIAQIVEEMNVGRTAVQRWVDQYRADQLGQPGTGNPLSIEQKRIRQLEQENRQLRSDNDLLKKCRPSLPAK